MGTLATAITRARIRARDTAKTLLTDDQLLELANENLENIHAMLLDVQSNLVVETGVITTESGKREYTAGFYFHSVIDNGVYIAGDTDPLPRVSEQKKIAYEGGSDGRPECFYVAAGRAIGFLPTPDAAYTINVLHVKPRPVLTAVSEQLPFEGIFDAVVAHNLAVDILAINERDTTVAVARLNDAFESAMSKVYDRGVIAKRMPRPAMFSVEGL